MARATRAKPAAPEIPTVPWAEFFDGLEWYQGEHFSLIGPTGQGKTTLAHELLTSEYHPYRVVVATKPYDDVLEAFLRKGANPRYKRIEHWPPRSPPHLQPNLVLWPKWKSDRDTPHQAEVIREALNDIMGERGWTVFIDELSYLCDMLGLDKLLRIMWRQGRSSGITILGSTQRQAWVPLELYSQATHVCFFRMVDKRDLERIGGLGTIDPEHIRAAVRTLDDFEFLYVNVRRNLLIRSKTVK